MVVWLLGLSGAGKTTIGRELWRIWREQEPNTVFVDGDEIRAVFKDSDRTDSHTVAGRRRNAERIFELCRWLDGQDLNVVCTILSIFPELRQQNRDAFSGYFEVFVDCSMETLIASDYKGLYAGAKSGKIPNVVGMDIPFPRPENADCTIDNSNHDVDPVAAAKDILAQSRSRK